MWTNEQQEAINENNCNLLVAAAAGSGKTAVLVERIIRLITGSDKNVDIDKLLVVTFTNAAATEMRERISEAVSKELEKSPHSSHIRKQLALLNKASITTIHSFCLEVIRNNFQCIDIDPCFRIADDTEASLIKLEVLDELFESLYEDYDDNKGNREFYELLESYSGNRDDQALQDMVLNLYNFVRSMPWPEKWLHEMAEGFNASEGLEFERTPWGTVLIQSAVLEVEGLKGALAGAVDVINEGYGLENYNPVFTEELGNIKALLGLLNRERDRKWDSIFKAFDRFTFGRLARAGKDADKAKQAYVKKIRDDVKKGIIKLKEKVFYRDTEEILKDMGTLYPLMKCFTGLVSEFGRRYTEKKNQKSIVDFNDLEHLCLDILTEDDGKESIRPSKTALSYKKRFEEILVDEYQDSNMVQEFIINMISRADIGNPNVFMVGDVKQSIYRFRQAKPELFLKKYNDYSMDKGSLTRKILLYKNFRSREEILNAVNFIFKQIMSVNIGELDYTDIEALNMGAVFEDNIEENHHVGGKTEFHLIQTDFIENDVLEEITDGEEQNANAVSDDDMEMIDRVQCEARIVANRIRELMQPDRKGRKFSVWDAGRKIYRNVEYRDIVILLRTTKKWSDVFMEEMAGEGIPVFADTGTGFFKTIEIQMILSLLQIIDNPLQDIPLLAVLRSQIFSFTTEELAELRLADPKGSLYEALKVLAEGVGSEASTKAAAFIEQLQKWRHMSQYLSTDQLIWQLYNDTGYYGIVGAMPAGEQRQANLRILFERARQFEDTSYKGLFNFINFVDKLKSGRGDMGSAKILGENDNVVRIMSIHKSKGLEFPVVILAGCGKRFNLQDMNRSILVHQELGLGPDVVDTKRRVSYPSVIKQAVREKIRLETLSEEMRILYVALTRAKEKLIITGTVNDVGKTIGKWCACAHNNKRRLPAHEVLKGGTYLDWIGPALVRHKDCGTLREKAVAGSEFSGILLKDSSLWSFHFWNKGHVLSGNEDLTPEEETVEWVDEFEIRTDDKALAKEIERRLGWKYPYEKIAGIPVKVSVSELKRQFDRELSEELIPEFPEYIPPLVKKPLFLQESKGLSAAEKGTVLHFVMQHLDYNNKDIKGQINEMVKKDLLTEQQAAGVETGKIEGFLQSALGRRMLAADNIEREVPFNINVHCSELFEDINTDGCENENMLLQGVIDFYFQEPDGIVLVDYKTDYVPGGGAEKIKERYRTQIAYYARALEMLTGKQVKERYVYLFYNGEILEY